MDAFYAVIAGEEYGADGRLSRLVCTGGRYTIVFHPDKSWRAV